MMSEPISIHLPVTLANSRKGWSAELKRVANIRNLIRASCIFCWARYQGAFVLPLLGVLQDLRGRLAHPPHDLSSGLALLPIMQTGPACDGSASTCSRAGTKKPQFRLESHQREVFCDMCRRHKLPRSCHNLASSSERT